MKNDIFVFIIDNSDIEFDKEEQSIIVHNGCSQIKFYSNSQALKNAIELGKWLIINCFAYEDNESSFLTGDVCFVIEEEQTENYGKILKVLSSKGKIGWVREQMLFKLNTRVFKKLYICACLD